eukprot:7391751-Prymnesium_polylepis.2
MRFVRIAGLRGAHLALGEAQAERQAAAMRQWPPGRPWAKRTSPTSAGGVADIFGVFGVAESACLDDVVALPAHRERYGSGCDTLSSLRWRFMCVEKNQVETVQTPFRVRRHPA